jgi:hypothetical protein
VNLTVTESQPKIVLEKLELLRLTGLPYQKKS